MGIAERPVHLLSWKLCVEAQDKAIIEAFEVV
jgi:hypothetical protein